MLRFIGQQTWTKQLYMEIPLEHVACQDWLVSIPTAEMEQMAIDLFGDAVDFSSLPKVELLCSFEDLEEQLDNLSFATENYYLPREDAYLSVAVYGFDLTDLEPVEVHLNESTITGTIRTNGGLERTYSFVFNKEKFPFLTILSID